MSIFHWRAGDLTIRALSRRIGSEQVMEFIQDLVVRRVAAQQLDNSINQGQIADRVIDLRQVLRLSFARLLFQGVFV